MSEPASVRRMTVAEILERDDGSDTVYELIDGVPVARYARSGQAAVVAVAPPAPRHGRIAGNVFAEIERRLEARRPCGAVVEGGVSVDDAKYYIADVAATCAPLSNEGFVREPFLVVEIDSASDQGTKAFAKVQDYIALPSVQEIWLVDSRRRWVQQWRRGGEDRWIVTLPLTGRAAFDSPTLQHSIELDRLYQNTGLDAPEATT